MNTRSIEELTNPIHFNIFALFLKHHVAHHETS